jgi:hypothetical protein
MSYPKKSITAGGIPNGSTASLAASQYGSATGKDVRAQKRREQLHTLLVNKFRGKYQIDIDADSGLDRVVRAEVARFLETEQMTESNLIKLDKRLAELLSKGASASVAGSQANPVRSRGGDHSAAGRGDY